MPSPWVLAPVPWHWDFCQRSPSAAGPALTAPPWSWPVLQGTAPNPDSPRQQALHSACRPQIQHALQAVAPSPMHSRSSLPRWAWHLPPRGTSIWLRAPGCLSSPEHSRTASLGQLLQDSSLSLSPPSRIQQDSQFLLISTGVHASCCHTSDDCISAAWAVNPRMLTATEKNTGVGCSGHPEVSGGLTAGI